MVGQERSMDSEETGDDDKSNVCPICERGFKIVGGLRQHCTKGHSADEIDAIIVAKTQNIFQQTPTDHSVHSSPTTHSSGIVWNKFQIISTGVTGVIYQQFNIIENAATGDCLFSSVLDF